jgi:TonB-linked SusC/RagA family outer membrane protein
MKGFLLQDRWSQTKWWSALFCVPLLLCLLLPVFFVTAQVKPPAVKKVTLHLTKAKLRNVIREIERQTRYTFAISSDVLETTPPITLRVRGALLENVLRSIFPPSKYVFEIKNEQIIVFPLNQAGNPITSPLPTPPPKPTKWQLTGQVTDGTNPLVGVSIREKGTTNGASTNENGVFELGVLDGQAVLQISLIGYETREVPVRDRKNIPVSLRSDLKNLNELVVLGYDIQKKGNLTGAISQIAGKRLQSRPVANVMAALQGTATGLQVTRSNGQPGKEGFNIQIRGLPSATSSNPLVIVDGIANSLSMLNPNDIESISVLKDAAATSIYGAQAAGGVVLVTTRTASPGKLTVEYNTLVGVETPMNQPKLLPSWEAAQMANTAAQNADRPLPWQPYEIDWMKDHPGRYAIDYNQPDYYKYYYNFNQLSLLTQSNSSIQTHNVAMKGGNDQHQFALSLGYFGRQGLFIVGPDNTSRINARLHLHTQLSKYVSLESRVSYAQTRTLSPSVQTDGPRGLLRTLYQAPGNAPIFVPGTDHYAYGSSPAYALLQDGGQRNEKNDFADAILTLRIDSLAKGLALRAIYSPQRQTYQDNLVQRSIPLWNRVAPVFNVQYPNLLEQSRVVKQGSNIRLLADYDFKAGARSNFHLLGSYSLESYRYEQNSIVAQGLSNEELNNEHISNPENGITARNARFGSLQSYSAKLNYIFDNRYLLEVNANAARLYQTANTISPVRNWQIFPSVSAGWRLNNESWFKNALPFFDDFKLRGSWGQPGNINGWSNYNEDLLRPFVRNAHPLNPFYNYLPVPLTSGWENITSTNAGWDIALFKGRLTLSADYFVKRHKNMPMPLLQPTANGPAFYGFNEGEMKARGWELNLGWRNNTPQFSYWLNGNISDSRNEVLRNDAAHQQYGLNLGLPGYSYAALFGYQANGYFQNENEVQQHAFQNTQTGPGDIRYQDINQDGKIDQHDLVYLGSSDPRYTYGFDAGFNWKGLDFSIFFQGVGQRQILIDPRYAMPFSDGWQQPWDINRDYWQPDNPNALFPRLYQQGTQNLVPSSHWIMNGAYLRLKNLQLGYTLTAPVLKKTPFSSVRIYFSGQDLWEFSHMKIKYFDPEQLNYNGYEYPFFRSYTFGLNIVF